MIAKTAAYRETTSAVCAAHLCAVAGSIHTAGRKQACTVRRDGPGSLDMLLENPQRGTARSSYMQNPKKAQRVSTLITLISVLNETKYFEL